MTLSFGAQDRLDDIQRSASGEATPTSHVGFRQSHITKLASEWLNASSAAVGTAAPLVSEFLLSLVTLPTSCLTVCKKEFPEKSPAGLNDYLNTVSYVDSRIEQLMDMLQARGLTMNNTVFAIVADHGEEFQSMEVGFMDLYTRVCACSHAAGWKRHCPWPAHQGCPAGARRCTPEELMGIHAVRASPLIAGKSLLSSNGHQRAYHSHKQALAFMT